MLDFRSDTISLPTQGMLDAMHSAKLGDDVFGEDPTVNQLESKLAQMFDMEAGLFCPSGTMTNQIAIKTHTKAGDEVICEELSHIYQYEGGGIAFNAGCSVKLLQGDRGRITASQVLASIQPDDVHRPITSLVSLENTTNRGGGACYDIKEIQSIQKVTKEKGLALHLDGARLFNALVATQEKPSTYGQLFDSISICLSKGLGAPVGSVLLGNKAFIKSARRWRKVFGGGMRQAGMLAAAGIYALDHQVERLAMDHQHAKAIEQALIKKDFVESVLPVETNIVIASVQGKYNATEFVEILKNKNIAAIAMSPTLVRFVVHINLTALDIEQTIDIINQIQ
jgi:threonine aldolase